MPFDYLRVRIQGTLTACSALHIGSGERMDFPETVIQGKESEIISYNAVVLDAGGKPYLAAASLRGFLAQAAAEMDADTRTRLFGDLNRAGAVRVYDARLHSSPAMEGLHDQPQANHTALRSHVSIDPVTGTAQDHLLFSLEYVPQGSVFELCVELDQVNEADLQAVLGLLDCWDGEVLSAVGSGTGKGRGRLEWELDQVTVIGQDDLRAWLQDATPLWKPIEPPSAVPLQRAAGYSVRFALRPHGPFLLNDRAYTQAKKNKEDDVPDFEFSRTPDGRALIPATALRGWLRARARRILATLLADEAPESLRGEQRDDVEKKLEALLAELFGDTDRRGPLRFGDAVSEKPITEHKQMFNAIDRFTGGVVEKKLYQAHAVECGELCGEVWLDAKMALAEEWHKGLLLLLARDLLEGDLVLGWGKGRGYGSFACSLEIGEQACADWPALRAVFAEQKGAAWLKALRNKTVFRIENIAA